jgi:glycosyltransferase involved in cell wall biosynthesis
MKPFISVTTPSFNRAKLVVDSLNSLLTQDYPKELFEVIMVDNNSKDNSVEAAKIWVKANEGEINFSIVIEHKKGLVYTRNTVAKNAKAEILIFCNDDAIYVPNWISAISEIYQLFPKIGAVGSKILIRLDKQPNQWIYKFEELLGRLDLIDGYIVRNKDIYINGGSFFTTKIILKQTEGFNPGQLGDYILGDSETVLCRKLHKLEIANEGILMRECDFEVELILANDCSSDKTDEVIEDILENHPQKSWLKYFKHEKNIGMMPNFIFSIKQCSGNYNGLCEGDDYWTDPYKFQKQVDFLELNEDLSLIGGKTQTLENNVLKEIIGGCLKKKEYEIEDIISYNDSITCMIRFRNKDLDYSSFNKVVFGDWLLYSLILNDGSKGKIIDEVFSSYSYIMGVL